VQIGTDLLETARVLRGDRYATETDRKPYAFGAKFGRPYSDVYVVDVKSGERRKALEKVRFFYGGSATGRKVAWYDGKDYWAQDVATGARTNLTAKVQAKFTDVDYDYPNDLTPPADFSGLGEGRPCGSRGGRVRRLEPERGRLRRPAPNERCAGPDDPPLRANVTPR
jgi:hypothetical protein